MVSLVKKINTLKFAAHLGLALCLSVSILPHAQAAEPTSLAAPLKAISGVPIKVQRLLKSQEGRYVLELTAGIWNPEARLIDLQTQQSWILQGLQKGNTLTLDTVMMSQALDQKTAVSDMKLIKLEGVLNTDNGTLQATLSDTASGLQRQVAFVPLVQVKNKPTFIFKFYGAVDAISNSKRIEAIDVIDKKTGKRIDRLTGFTAQGDWVEYKDLNYDGHFDLVLVNADRAVDPQEQQYIYWMYNPKTNQYQRSPKLEKITGYPKLIADKQQLEFGNGQLYQIENGMLKRL